MTTIITRAGKGTTLSHVEGDTNLKLGTSTTGINYTVLESDNRNTIECSAAVTITMPTASTIISSADTGDFQVTIKNISGGTVTITCNSGTDTIEGSTDDITILDDEAVTLKVNNSGNGYNIVSDANRAISTATVQTLSGSTAITFSSIPAWVKKITLMVSGVQHNASATNGWTSVSLGDSGGVETSGYEGVWATGYYTGSGYSQTITATASADTNRARIFDGTANTIQTAASVDIILLDASTNTWIIKGIAGETNTDTIDRTISTFAYSKSLSGQLTTVQLYTAFAFTGGKANIIYE